MSSMQDMMYEKRPAWLTFVAVVLFSVGILRVLSAIYYFADSVRVASAAINAGAFGSHLFLWGLWDLVIALLAFWAGYSVLNGEPFGRIIGYVWAILVIVQSFLIIQYAPWFAFGMLILAALVIYGLAVTSDYRADEAAPASPAV